MMLTLIFLRFMGEKYEIGLENLKESLRAEGLNPEDKILRLHL